MGSVVEHERRGVDQRAVDQLVGYLGLPGEHLVWCVHTLHSAERRFPSSMRADESAGWTSGPWGTDAPWTTWTACTASTTATSVVTTTVTTGGSTVTETTTGFGIQVAQATNGASAASSTSSGSAAMPTNYKLAGSAAGAIGIVAGALLL